MRGSLSAPNSKEENNESSLNPEAPEFTIYGLPRATPGSAGLDVASSEDAIFSR